MSKHTDLQVAPDDPIRALAKANKEKLTSRLYRFTFANDTSRDDQCVQDAFVQHGMVAEAIERQSFSIWTYVLVDDGSLWLLDKSHGGGGYFSPA